MKGHKPNALDEFFNGNEKNVKPLLEIKPLRSKSDVGALKGKTLVFTKVIMGKNGHPEIIETKENMK